ncbi:Hypothetical predicted protein [Mytilus galloprovincialis]|uniref:Secreted protein n=1 Tax=Mytilus galloprovincialis TaxID=29158 RepID=A0A8B6CFH4_MYTGA|nr:Hypothetical predicted protein [Mytilus galloprovincialis]
MQLVTFATCFVFAVLVKHVSGCGLIVCEARSGYIKCPYASRILVTSAIYGRSTDASICPGAIRTTHCRSAVQIGWSKGNAMAKEFVE